MAEDTESVIMTRPVFDVYSISIHPSETRDCPNPLSDGKLCHIYGTVKVCDEYENVYHIYNRKEHNPDIIRLDGDITLIGFPVIRSKLLTVSVYIYDMAHQAEISNGTFVLDYSSDYPYDELSISEVKGQYGFAKVHHATFLHAVVADVEEVLVKKENSESGDLFGSVVVCLERGGGEEYASALLFDNGLKDQECKSVPVPAKFNTRVQLFRSCVAVPAFCTLKIKVDFHDKNGGRISKHIVQHDYSWSTFEECVVDQNCAITVRVEFPPCYGKFPGAIEIKDQVNAKQVFTQNLKSINIKSQLSSEAEEDVTRFKGQFRRLSNLSLFVEVFSLLIFSDDNDIDIHGTVKLVDSLGESLHIFKGSDKLSTERRTLAIQCPPSRLEISDKRFEVVVSLKNGKNRVVGEGIRLWNDMNIDGFLDKHLCSVFKGDNAYTAVHYSMFEFSAYASIVASFVGKDIPQVPETEVRVCGSITAEYGSYEYSTPYDQENYKFRLFSRSEDECSQFHWGSNLELGKSLVAVPSEDTLVFNVNLKVGLGVDQKFEALQQVVEFEPYKSNIFVLEKCHYTFFMWVEWSDGNYPKPFTYPNLSDMRSLRKVMPKIPLKV